MSACSCGSGYGADICAEPAAAIEVNAICPECGQRFRHIAAPGEAVDGPPSVVCWDCKKAIKEVARLSRQHPDLAEAVISFTLLASPLAGPQRILAELQTAVETER